MSVTQIKRFGIIVSGVVYLGLFAGMVWWVTADPSLEKLNLLMDVNAALLQIILVMLIIGLVVSATQ